MYQVKAFSKNKLLRCHIRHLKTFSLTLCILLKFPYDEAQKTLEDLFRNSFSTFPNCILRLSKAGTTHYMTNLFPYFHHPLFNSAFLAFQLCCLYRQEQAAFSNPYYKRFRRAMSAKFVSISQPYKGV